jgi:hypothetical protein
MADIVSRLRLLEILASGRPIADVVYRSQNVEVGFDTELQATIICVQNSPDDQFVVKDSSRRRLQAIRDLDYLIDIMAEES